MLSFGVKKRKNKAQRQPIRQIFGRKKPKSLAGFRRPSKDQAKDGKTYIKDVYETPVCSASVVVIILMVTVMIMIHLIQFKNVNGSWSIGAAWHGSQYNGFVYYEPLNMILSIKIQRVLDFINDTHGKYPVFSAWWQSVCHLPDVVVITEQLIFLERLQIYVIIKDVVQRERTWIYPGYSVVVASGHEVDVTTEALDFDANIVIEIYSDDVFTSFDDFAAAKHDYFYNDAKSCFYSMYGAFNGKIKKGGKPGKKYYKNIISMSLWSIFLKKKCDDNHIGYKETKKQIKVSTISRKTAKKIFDEAQEYEKEDKINKYFMEQIDIKIIKASRSININGIQCNKPIKYKLDKDGKKKKTFIIWERFIKKGFCSSR